MPIDFRMGDFLAPGALVQIGRSMARLERADPAELRAYQVRRLRTVLGHAARHVPHWRALFAEIGFDPRELSEPEAVRRLPVLEKDTLRAAGVGLRSVRAGSARGHWVTTSGTSGRPVRVLHDARAQALEFCYYRRAWGWAGYRLGATFAELGGHHFLCRGRDPERLVQWQPLVRRLMINSLRLSPGRMPEVRAALARHRPRFLKGLPSVLEHLAVCAEEDGSAGIPMQAVFSGGEVVTERARVRIERAFGCRLFDSYGHMERTVAISQCEEGRYHVHGDFGLLEVRDVERGADGRDTGRATGTGLHNLAMPLVRYDIGDTIELAHGTEPCPCGRTLPLVHGILGREADVIHTPDGRALSALTTILANVVGVDTLQILHLDPGMVELRVVPGRAWSGRSREELERLGRSALGKDMRCEVTLVERDGLVRSPAGKTRPVVGLGG